MSDSDDTVISLFSAPPPPPPESSENALWRQVRSHPSYDATRTRDVLQELLLSFQGPESGRASPSAAGVATFAASSPASIITSSPSSGSAVDLFRRRLSAHRAASAIRSDGSGRDFFSNLPPEVVRRIVAFTGLRLNRSLLGSAAPTYCYAQDNAFLFTRKANVLGLARLSRTMAKEVRRAVWHTVVCSHRKNHAIIQRLRNIAPTIGNCVRVLSCNTKYSPSILREFLFLEELELHLSVREASMSMAKTLHRLKPALRRLCVHIDQQLLRPDEANLTAESAAYLAAALTLSPKLAHGELCAIGCRRTYRTLLLALARLPNLRYLRLQCAYSSTLESVRMRFDGDNAFPGLEELVIDPVGSLDVSALNHHLFQARLACPTLKRLELSEIRGLPTASALSTDVFPALEALRLCRVDPTLWYLRLCDDRRLRSLAIETEIRNEDDLESFDVLLQVLRGWPALRTVSIKLPHPRDTHTHWRAARGQLDRQRWTAYNESLPRLVAGLEARGVAITTEWTRTNNLLPEEDDDAISEISSGSELGDRD